VTGQATTQRLGVAALFVPGAGEQIARADPYLETAANLLELLERVFRLFSKRALKSLNNQADFDSSIRRYEIACSGRQNSRCRA
jgi:hypothetical protein